MDRDSSLHGSRQLNTTTAYRDNSAASPSSSRSPSPDGRHSGSESAEHAAAVGCRSEHIGSGTSSAACSDNDGDNVRRADSARGSFTALSAVVIPGSDITQASSTSAAAHQATDNFWKDDLSNLLTPQTVMEQAQVQRRKRNREAARRSRLKQKERERELVERQTQLSERMRFLQQEVEEWRIINSTAPRATQSPSQTLTLPLSSRLIDPEQVLGKEDGDLAENINNVYTLTVETLHIIAELQLQLDEITKELDEMIGDSTSR